MGYQGGNVGTKINFKVLLYLTAFLQMGCGRTGESAVNEESYASPSIYYIRTIDPSAACTQKSKILDGSGKVIAEVCTKSYNECTMEGTCALKAEPNYKIINYTHKVNGEPRFTVLDAKTPCRFGYGVQNICLDPYYSVAADLAYHKAGEVIFIKEMRDVLLPNGERHKGYFMVRDRGGAIKGPNRFDFFTGFLNYTDKKNVFTDHGFASTNSEIAYSVVTGSEAENFLKLRQYPLIPKARPEDSEIGPETL